MDFAGCDVVELRRYLLRPGGFDDLQAVFQPWLVDGQEKAGMRLGGQFRDLDQPDRFVWFRGFSSMTQRHAALEEFYFGPLWREHAAAANATMIDSDDVLLLRPVHRPSPPGVGGSSDHAIVEIWSLPSAPSPALAELLATAGHEALEQASGQPVAMWRTEPSRNTFQQLPVRDGDHLVWLAVFPGEGQFHSARTRLGADPGWQRVTERLVAAGATVERMRLSPTETSRHPAPRG